LAAGIRVELVLDSVVDALFDAVLGSVFGSVMWARRVRCSAHSK